MNLKNLIKIIIRDSIIKLFSLFGYVGLQKKPKDFAFNKVLKKLIIECEYIWACENICIFGVHRLI